uniref:Reverse transcriptase domain-containing protein n=1 Tax=Tanacetum cinerariifolium TaxID=118510 RepID=A0A699JIF3_TANCI|nr:hypothetical protein [Tanacetum cinerariifolium]
MTRSSTKELFTPFENPERAFRSKRRLFETPGLVESSSPEFDLFSNIEERDTRPNNALSFPYVPNWSRELLAKEQTVRFDYKLGNPEIKISKQERFKELLMKCPQHYLTDTHEVILFYNGLDVPTRQILDSKGAIPTKTVVDAKVDIQEMAKYAQKWHNRTSTKTRSIETSNGLAVIQAQLNSIGREIKKVNEKVYTAQVKENKKKDKIGSKPDKNGKRGEAGKSQKPLQLKEEEKPKKTKKEWPKTHSRIKSYSSFKEIKKEKSQKSKSSKVQV